MIKELMHDQIFLAYKSEVAIKTNKAAETSVAVLVCNG